MKRNVYSKMYQWFDPWLKTDRIYIFPTSLGLYFIVFIFILFGISLTYGHSLAFSTTFFIFSLTLVSTIMTNENLRYLSITSYPKNFHTHQSDKGKVRFTLYNNSSSVKYAKVRLANTQNCSALIELKAFDSRVVDVNCVFDQRGVFEVPKAYIEGVYPFGLFKSWLPVDIRMKIIVAPKIYMEALDDLNSYESSSFQDDITYEQSPYKDNDRDEFLEFEYIKEFNHEQEVGGQDIDWKIFAKKREFYKKIYSSSLSNDIYVVDFSKIKGSLEERLSKSMTYIYELEKKGLVYKFLIDGSVFRKNTNSSTYKELQRVLAVYKNDVQLRLA